MFSKDVQILGGIAKLTLTDYRDRGENLPMKTITRQEFLNINKKSPDNLDVYTKLAEEYAKKYFSGTNVISVAFDGMNVKVTGRDSDRNRLFYNETTLDFTAINETGKKIRMSLVMETEVLINIGTSTETERTERNEDTAASRNTDRTREDKGDVFIDTESEDYEEFSRTREESGEKSGVYKKDQPEDRD